MATLDVIRTEIIRNQLVSATDEMTKILVRTAYSLLLYEIQHFGAAITSSAGQMLRSLRLRSLRSELSLDAKDQDTRNLEGGFVEKRTHSATRQCDRKPA